MRNYGIIGILRVLGIIWRAVGNGQRARMNYVIHPGCANLAT
jgi:hypothetical protein